MQTKEKSIPPDLNKLVRSLAESKSRSEPVAFWPLHPAILYSSLLPSFPSYIIKTIDRLKEKVTDQDIAKMFLAPSRLSVFLHFLHTHKIFDWILEQKRRFANDVVKYMGFYRYDPYCLNWNNVILSEKEIREILNKPLIDANNEVKHFSGVINTMMFEYTEMIFLGTHYLGHEFHGPYPCKDGQLLVREFFDLKPKYWAITKNFPFNKIKIYEVYNKNVKIEYDIFNHEITSAPLPKHLQKYLILIDGQEIKPGNFPKELNKLLNFWTAISNKIKLTDREYVKKSVETFYWLLKPLKDKLGENWKPSEEQYKFIEKLNIAALKEKLFTTFVKARVEKTRRERYEMFVNMFNEILELK